MQTNYGTPYSFIDGDLCLHLPGGDWHVSLEELLELANQLQYHRNLRFIQEGKSL
jgi:hypothetical protein